MKFQETVDTVGRWIDSCMLSDQLNLCRDAIDNLVFARYKNHIGGIEMAHALTFLETKILQKDNDILKHGN